jgi:restriction endonuclease Mrr
MEELPELPAEIVEEPREAEPERLMEIVIKVCERHGFVRKGEESSTHEESPKR